MQNQDGLVCFKDQDFNEIIRDMFFSFEEDVQVIACPKPTIIPLNAKATCMINPDNVSYFTYYTKQEMLVININI